MKKIAIVGSINMDLTCHTERHPKKGETLLGKDLQYVPGGKGANQAVAASRLGGDVTMYGCVGDDVFAERLIENLRRNGVNTEHIQKVSGISSGIALITVAEKDNPIVVIPGANGRVTPLYLEQEKEHILEADYIVLQNEIPSESNQYIIKLAREHGKKVIYNPAPFMMMEKSQIDQIDYLTPNEHEARLLFPECQSLEEALRSCNEKLIVTLGEEGAAAFSEGKKIFVPARKAQVADTTGAGDTFNGAFAYALATGKTFEESLYFANVAASLSTEGYGAQGGMPTLQEVEQEL